jgi:tricorn protease
MNPLVLLPLLTALSTGPGDPVPAGMLRYPDVSETHIVFSYANDLWLVPRSGGVATPLASPAGRERFPRFSPDGQSIAFVGNYEGNNDLYTIAATGGIAQRITHHPSTETLCDWLPNGDLLFYANGLAGLRRQAQIFTVSERGGMPKAMPIPYGTVSAISGNGEWLAYTPRTRDARTWKRYQGGLATDIWLFNLKDHSAQKITDWMGTDTQPMWWGNTLYYLSDAGENHRLNIWKYSLKSGKSVQVTHFADDDIRWPSVGPGYAKQGEIVFQLGSELKLLNLKMGKLTTVEVVVPGDRLQLRPKQVDASKFIQSWSISPSGKRAVADARGDIWTAPLKNGTPRNLSHSNGSAERSPAWSPDGQWIAYFSDATGEYELYMTQSDGKGETRQLTNLSGLFKLGMVWSPDSKSIAYLDCGGNLYLHSLESGETKLIDDSPFGFWVGSISSPNWSHDSRWLTYSKVADKSAQTAIWIYDTQDGGKHQVTSGFFGDASPTFDRQGKYLYFTSGRNFSPSYSSIDSSFIYEDNQVLLAVPLQADAERLWTPKSDEEKWDDDAEEDGKEEDGTEDSEDEGPEQSAKVAATDDGLSGSWSGTMVAAALGDAPIPLTVDLSLGADLSVSGSITTPLGTATVDSGSYDSKTGALSLTLTADEGFSVTIKATVTGGSMKGTGEIPSEGISFTFEVERSSTGSDDKQEGDEPSDKDVAEKVEIDFEGFEARAIQLPPQPGQLGSLAVNDKNQLLYSRGGSKGGIKLFDIHDDKPSEKSVGSGRGFMISANGKKILAGRGQSATIQNAAAGSSTTKVKTAGMNVRIDPRVEWQQLFTDAWRIFRDYFYDPNMHGVDWQWVHDHYSAMIAHCATREDVSFLIGEMIAEVNVGHAYMRGNGDGSPNGPSVSVGMLGVDFELQEGAYRLVKILRGAAWDSDAISPLGMPGVDVSEGDYLLAVNGTPIDVDQDPWAAFTGFGGKEITLTVSAKPALDEEAREVIVKALSSETNLRYRNWIESKRQYVEEKSGGRLAYIYVPDTGLNGQNNLFRQFYGQILKPGMIIDERWNGGGQIPTRFIELLNRPATNYWATRGAKDIHWPPDSHQGPKCMLINEDAGSGGDAFPSYFRRAGLGKLIGRRTWGGLIGISGNPSLIDGGGITVPTFGYYDTDGTWGIEGYGVAPDIDVVDDPALMTDGGDPQLDAAIAHMLSELDTHPYVIPKRPVYPDRSGAGVTEADK